MGCEVHAYKLEPKKALGDAQSFNSLIPHKSKCVAKKNKLYGSRECEQKKKWKN